MPNIVRTTAAALMAAAVVPFASSVASAAADKNDVPSVDVIPVGTSSHDPNRGGWFVLQLKPGASASSLARIKNPADVAQTVQFYARDLAFSSAGVPSLVNTDSLDVGHWIQVGRSEVTVPAHGQVDVPFSVTVPSNAEPGDHIGALVAQSAPSGGTLHIIKRVATRFTVTVPGAAIRSFALLTPHAKLDSPLWPGSFKVDASVRNTGRIRLSPKVTLNGHPMSGSTLALAQSVEPYTGSVHVPWYGGRVHMKVRVTTEAGTQTREITRFVIPWGLLAIAVVALVALVHVLSYIVRRWRRWRAEQAALRAKLAELEASVTASSLPSQRSSATDQPERTDA